VGLPPPELREKCKAMVSRAALFDFLATEDVRKTMGLLFEMMIYIHIYIYYIPSILF